MYAKTTNEEAVHEAALVHIQRASRDVESVAQGESSKENRTERVGRYRILKSSRTILSDIENPCVYEEDFSGHRPQG